MSEKKVNFNIILTLVKRDFQSRYKNSLLYTIWPFLHPVIQTFTLWFVFTYGFKNQSTINNIPFILWLITGLVPWYFISEALSKGIISVKEHSYIIKNIHFYSELFPIIKILSCLLTHIFFIITLIIMLYFYNSLRISLFIVNIIYFALCSIFLTLSINYFTSSIFVFFKDITEIIRILINFFFWTTPIIWNINILPQHMKIFFKLNPIYYIVNGYRNAFLYNISFWENIHYLVYFWILIIFLFSISILFFKKSKKYFGDFL